MDRAALNVFLVRLPIFLYLILQSFSASADLVCSYSFKWGPNASLGPTNFTTTDDISTFRDPLLSGVSYVSDFPNPILPPGQTSAYYSSGVIIHVGGSYWQRAFSVSCAPAPCVASSTPELSLYGATVESFNGTTLRVLGAAPLSMCIAGCTYMMGGPQSEQCYGVAGFPVGSALSCEWFGNRTGPIGGNDGSCTVGPEMPGAVAMPANPTANSPCPAGEVMTSIDGVSQCVTGVIETTNSTTRTVTNADGSTTTTVTTTSPTGAVTETVTTTSPELGTTTSTSTREGVESDFSMPDNSGCAENPDRVGCMGVGEESDITGATISEQAISTTITPKPITSASACPAPVSVPIGGVSVIFDYSLICQFASGIRAVVLALAWLSAGMIMIGAVRG